jgi:phospholipase C
MASEGVTRRAFLQRSGAAGAALLGGSLWATAPRAAKAQRPRDSPIRNLVISCQENRSFDHYYGFAPEVQRRGFGPPLDFAQPDAAGGLHRVFHQTALRTRDADHSWAGSHRQYAYGQMDGFYESSGDVALGYHTAAELPFYYSLFDAPDAALCASYFCSLLGPTSPNRFYLMSGTSGGVTSNGFCCFGVFDSGRWPIILDLLDEAGITWRIYNRGGIEDIFASDIENVVLFWTRWADDPRARGTHEDYLRDCAAGTLPAVSWLIPSYTKQLDEHPPADVSAGMRLQQEQIEALRASPQYARSAFLLVYDEHGGLFDHVAPPRLDAYGLGFRVPFWVISPLLRRRGVIATRRPAEHVSTLKLIERLYGLPTLASRNHTFDEGTPVSLWHEAYGAPAPPRDGLSAISDLTELFELGGATRA